MQTAGSGARLRRIRRSTARWLLIAAGALLLTILIGGAVVDLYTEALWFGALGHAQVLWTRIGTHVAVRVVAGAIAATVVAVNLLFVTRHLGPVHLRRRYGNLEIAEQVPRTQVTVGVALVALLAGWWLSGVQFGADSALGVFAWLRSAPWGVADPLFGNDLAFYVFGLPVIARFVTFLLLVLAWSALLAVLGYALLGAIRVRDNRVEVDEGPRLHFALLLAATVLIFGVRYWLGRYNVLVDGSGFGGTVGYTDAHARLPARSIIALVSVATAGAVLFGALRGRWTPALVSAGVLFVAGLVGAVIYPSAVQKLRVEPNQLERERVYIDWLIEYTRMGFDLDAIERQRWQPGRAGAALRAQTPAWIDALPLWDAAPLKTALQQETGREYYDFHDVDFDRYRTNGELRQIAIAVRERSTLPAERQTWRNIHIEPTYTHGLGAVVTVASEAARGDPVFWLVDLDPVERDPLAPAQLELQQPRIYFGETMDDYVVLNPLADSAGGVAPVDSVTSGIRLDSFLRVLAFSWRFGDKNLLFSGDRGPRSRLLFRRTVVERVSALAPFLVWDADTYPVIWHGHVVWIVDGYSATASFPVSESLELGERTVRYMRSSAKAVVDGVSGEVTLYAMDEMEPLLATYRRVFPELIQPLAALPPELSAHLRYPPAFAAVQAEKLARFHVQRADAFYSGQIAWQRPSQGGTQEAPGAYPPLFLIAALPGRAQAEFLLSTPFIAAGRQNMTGVLLIRNDPPHYGEALLLDLSGADVVRGPSQVRSLVEQDAVISAQLALWRSGGSDVELGQMRVIPLDSAVLYVEPLFLSAVGSALPQLQQVIVSDGTAVSMAETLVDAIAGLGRERADELATPATPATPSAPGPWAAEAVRLQEAAERALRAGDWATFGERWNELQSLLRRAAAQRAGPP